MSSCTSVVQPKEQLQKMLRDTILAVEDMLNQLPQKGDTVEVTTTTERKAPPGIRTTKDVVRSDRPRQLVSQPSKAEVVPGSVCVNSLRNIDGVTIDVVVKVSTSDGSRLILMTIECPEYIPRRLKYDNKWYEIV